MSSFNNSPHPIENTIFYGTSETKEKSYTENTTQLIYAPLWDESTEKEYMDRVKAKAKEEAARILEKAFAEAEQIRAKAKEEGFAEGEKVAKTQIENISIEYVRYFESFLHAMEEYSYSLYDKLEKDVIALVQTSVERITSILIDEKNKEILKQALLEAIHLVTMDKEFIISVNPEDYQAILDVIHTLYEVYPPSKQWSVKKNSDIPLGSCQFEDSINVISVNRQRRKEKVMEVLSTIHFLKE